MTFFFCVCVSFFLESAHKKKARQKTRAHFSLFQDDIKNALHTCARTFLCVSRRGGVGGVVGVAFLLATRKRRGERERRASSFLYVCKDFRCHFFSLVECKERGPRGRRDEIIIIVVV